MTLHAVILAGGRGERFWPLSRKGRPKQFLRLFGEHSLLQATMDRLVGWIPEDRRWIVAGETLLPEIRRQIPQLLEQRIIAEPIARNTAAAIGAAAAVIEGTDPGATMLVLPSDHWVPDAGIFRADVDLAAAAAARHGGLHLFGIPIHYPETGYGYVERGEPLPGHEGVFRVARFREKPNRELAIEFARRSDMFWNSGIFVWRAVDILAAITARMAGLGSPLEEIREAVRGGASTPEARRALDRFFRSAPEESIDYAVLERHAETFVTRARFRWSDLGTWLSWSEHLEPDPSGNRGKGNALLDDSRDCVFYAEDGWVALLGVRNLIVVRLDDVTLVCDRDSAQDVRRLAREVSQREDLRNLF